jgi:YVTN family beta-propeller protein
MAISPDDQWVYVSSSANSLVYVINTTSGNKEKDLHVGSGPTGISFTSDGMACLVNSADGTVMVIDSNGRKPVKTLTIGSGSWPEEIAIDPYDRIAMVPGMSDGSLTIIETNGWSVVSKVSIGGNPMNIAYDVTSGVFYVSDMTGGQVLAVDPQGKATPLASITTPRSLIAESHGSRVFVASPDNGTISIITVTDSRKPVTFHIGHKPISIAPVYMTEEGLPVATATPIPTSASTTVTVTPTPTMLPHPTVTSTPTVTPTPTPTPAPTSIVLPLLAIGAVVVGLALKRRD